MISLPLIPPPPPSIPPSLPPTLPPLLSPIVLRQALLYVDKASAGRAQNTILSASASALSKTAISAGFRPVVSYSLAMRVCKIIHIFLTSVLMQIISIRIELDGHKCTGCHLFDVITGRAQHFIIGPYRERGISHISCVCLEQGNRPCAKRKLLIFFKKLVDKLPRAIRNLQKNFLSRSSFGLGATSEVLDDPSSLFHPTLCYATPYHRQTDRQTSCRIMPKYIMLSRISAELGKTGD